MRKILSALLVVAFFWTQAVLAATTANSIVTAQTPNNGKLQLTANPGTYGTLYTAGPNGSKCVEISSTNSDSGATHLLTVQVVNNATKYGGVALTSVVSAGFVSGTPPQSLTAPAVWTGLPTDSDGNPFLMLVSGDTLQATYATALTTGVINFRSTCYDF